MKILKTHGGFILIYRDKIFKITYNKNVKYLYSNQQNFFLNSNQFYLLKTKCLFISNRILITSEKYLKDIVSNVFTFDEILTLYGKLINKNIKVVDSIVVQNFIKKNFPHIKNDRYHKEVNTILNSINLLKIKTTIGLIHGDFWKENIIKTKRKTYFIDYDRSRNYSFLEFDLINYFVFYYVYEKNTPSWNLFYEITEELMKKKDKYKELYLFIDKFYSLQKINNNNRVILDQLIRLFVIKILYDNNVYLENIQYLKWRRSRKKIEELLWS